MIIHVSRTFTGVRVKQKVAVPHLRVVHTEASSCLVTQFVNSNIDNYLMFTRKCKRLFRYSHVLTVISWVVWTISLLKKSFSFCQWKDLNPGS